MYRFEDAKRLFDGLSARQQEVLDYCVRVYDGPLGSGGSCIYAPSSEYALKCSQVRGLVRMLYSTPYTCGSCCRDTCVRTLYHYAIQ